MTLPTGTQFGAYEILGPIGAGGMGEVYRARDGRLHRDVAIKVLPEETSTNRDAIRRFQREAQAASALNHPHILTIYEIGQIERGGSVRDYIAMEYITGDTLRQRMERETELPETLELLIQIAEGLAKAHEANIVHRDLKPDNIMVTADGYAKILDFGLAKLTAGEVSTGDPTAVAFPSDRHALVGTIGYVSPEQVAGAPADQRSDIFAFGCIAYESVARKRAFAGRSAIETLHQIAAVEPPPLRSLERRVPPDLQRIINRCLAKDPAARYQSMQVVVADLRRVRDRLRDRGPRTLPRLTQLTFDRVIEQFPAITADGSRLAFSREVGKVRKLFLKTIGEATDEPLTDGAFDDTLASWSPSGEALLFVRGPEPDLRVEPSDVFGRFVGGDIWLLDVRSRKASLLISNAFNPSWSPDGRRVAFDASWSGARRIWLTDERARNPQQLTTDVSDAISHVRPRWSPDGRFIVFQNLEGTKFDIRAVNVETKQMQWVTNDYTMDVHPVWSPAGDAVFISSYRSGGLNVWRIPVDVDGTPVGPMEQISAGAGHDIDLDASRGGRLVFSIMKQNADLWRLPVDPHTGAPSGKPEPVVESTRENSRGAWAPDGKSIAFSSDRVGEMNLFTLRDGKIRQLTRGAGGDFQPNWSPDGRSLVFFSGRSGALDIWKADLESEQLTLLTHGHGININPFFSPDGTRIAFHSDRDGGLEVWLMNADGSDARQLTRVGVSGHFLRWSGDGERIHFRCPTGKTARTMVVPVAGGDPVETPEVIGGAHMSLSPDQSMIMDVVGHRVLWVSPLRGGSPRRVFEFDDADSRIDYPVWSPDGRWVLFDRFVPRGGDIWMVEDIGSQ